MTPQITLVFALLVGAAVLLATERVRPDVVAMGVLATLLLSGLIDAEAAFGAFSNSAVIILGSVFVLSEGLAQTGFAARVARLILGWSGHSERRLVLLVMVVGATLSAFMHNTGAAAILLPAVLTVAQETGRSPSRLLFPLSIAILAGGSLTLVGTAPNILVSEAMRQRGMDGFGFFAFSGVALPVLLVLVALTVLFYDRLFPERGPGQSLTESSRLRDYLSELRVEPDSALVDHTLDEVYAGSDGRFTLVGLIRGGARLFAPPRSLRVRAGDVLIVRGRLDDVHEMRERWKLQNAPEVTLSAGEIEDSGDMGLAEVTLSPRSSLIGQTLKRARIQQRYGLLVLGIWRQGAPLRQRLSEVRFRYGDFLLVMAPRAMLDRVQEEHDLLLLQEVRAPLGRPRKAPLALAILVVVVALIVLDVLPTAVALFLGAGAMVVTGCLTMERAYEIIDWRTLFIVAGMLPLGTVMEDTGAARLLAERMLGVVGDAAPIWLLAGVFVVTLLLGEVVSNDVSTLLVAPLALTLATAAGLSPLPFLMTVAIAAGSPFITPMSHGPNLLILGPGNYRFRDFTIVGVPLSLVILGISMLLIPLLFRF